MSKLSDMIDRMPIYQNVRCGVDIGEGWVPIVERLGEQLTALGGVTVTQTKSKFGGLRCYHDASCDHEGAPVEYDYDAAEALVKAAEDECWRTCEECGAPGERRGGAWILTHCDTCHAAQLQKWREQGRGGSHALG